MTLASQPLSTYRAGPWRPALRHLPTYLPGSAWLGKASVRVGGWDGGVRHRGEYEAGALRLSIEHTLAVCREGRFWHSGDPDDGRREAEERDSPTCCARFSANNVSTYVDSLAYRYTSGKRTLHTESSSEPWLQNFRTRVLYYLASSRARDMGVIIIIITGSSITHNTPHTLAGCLSEQLAAHRRCGGVGHTSSQSRARRGRVVLARRRRLADLFTENAALLCLL